MAKRKSTQKGPLKAQTTALIVALLSFLGLSAYTGLLKPLIDRISTYIAERFEEKEHLYGNKLSVHDGDTLTLDGAKVRLYGIDAPELSQKYGIESRDQLITLVAEAEKRGDNISVTVIDTDRYGRNVGILILGEVNANKEMLTEGGAWYYAAYCKKSFCKNWEEEEEVAKKRRSGLWQDKNPTPPWEYRHQ